MSDAPGETPRTRRSFHAGLTVLVFFCVACSGSPDYALLGLVAGLAGLFFAMRAPS